MRTLMLFLFMACTLTTAHAISFTTQVIAVLDGDTVLVKRLDRLEKIRLDEIDAPEVGHAGMGGLPSDSQQAQPFGESSRQSLSGMVMGKQVQVISQSVDQYGRMVGHLSINGLSVNAEQIRRGMAWEYSNFHRNRTLVALQDEARQAQRGLWSQDNPIPPWDWRTQHPVTVSAQPVVAALPTSRTALDPACRHVKKCSQMTSCSEARREFSRCGSNMLDGDKDGKPCEQLCGMQESNK